MQKSNLRILLRTVLITYILTAFFLIILAFSLYQFHLLERQVNLGIHLIYTAVCLIGGIIMGKSVKVRRFIWGFLTGSAYFLILFAVSSLIHKEIGGNLRELALIFIMCAGSGTAGGMIS